MNSLLYDLYNGDYDITPKPDEKQQKLLKQLCIEWDKVQTMFGDKFLDHLMELEGEREDRLAFHYYQEGFRLGVRLMMEALTPHPGSTALG